MVHEEGPAILFKCDSARFCGSRLGNSGDFGPVILLTVSEYGFVCGSKR